MFIEAHPPLDSPHYRIWNSKNPHFINERRMHPQRITIWCEFWTGDITQPYFLKNEAGQTVNVISAQFLEPFNIALSKLDDTDRDDMRFQQDGTRCRISNGTIQLQYEAFRS